MDLKAFTCRCNIGSVKAHPTLPGNGENYGPIHQITSAPFAYRAVLGPVGFDADKLQRSL